VHAQEAKNTEQSLFERFVGGVLLITFVLHVFVACSFLVLGIFFFFSLFCWSCSCSFASLI
jgi:hypothetical protein